MGKVNNKVRVEVLVEVADADHDSLWTLMVTKRFCCRLCCKVGI